MVSKRRWKWFSCFDHLWSSTSCFWWILHRQTSVVISASSAVMISSAQSTSPPSSANILRIRSPASPEYHRAAACILALSVLALSELPFFSVSSSVILLMQCVCLMVFISYLSCGQFFMSVEYCPVWAMIVLCCDSVLPCAAAVLNFFSCCVRLLQFLSFFSRAICAVCYQLKEKGHSMIPLWRWGYKVFLCKSPRGCSHKNGIASRGRVNYINGKLLQSKEDDPSWN